MNTRVAFRVLAFIFSGRRWRRTRDRALVDRGAHNTTPEAWRRGERRRSEE